MKEPHPNAQVSIAQQGMQVNTSHKHVKLCYVIPETVRLSDCNLNYDRTNHISHPDGFAFKCVFNHFNAQNVKNVKSVKKCPKC